MSHFVIEIEKTTYNPGQKPDVVTTRHRVTPNQPLSFDTAGNTHIVISHEFVARQPRVYSTHTLMYTATGPNLIPDGGPVVEEIGSTIGVHSGSERYLITNLGLG